MNLFLERNSIYAGKFDVSCGMLSNAISLVLCDSDMDSENVSLIRLFVSDGQFKGCIIERYIMIRNKYLHMRL